MQHLRIELHRQNYEVRRRNTATTKLDAPYTTISIRGRASRIPVSSEVKGEELQAFNVHLQDLMPPESPTETATTNPAAALIDKLPKDSDQKQESQRFRTKSEHPLVGKALIKIRNNSDRGKTNNGSTSAIRFTSPKQGPYREVTLESEAQDAPPVTIRKHLSASPEDSLQKHFSASPEDSSQKHRPAPEQNFDFATEHEKRSLRYGNQPDSVPIIREESEGKDPGTAYRAKDGNIFMVRKHFTMNPYERLQAIQEVGEITSREQAMGLHGAYHLALEEEPEESAEVLNEKL